MSVLHYLKCMFVAIFGGLFGSKKKAEEIVAEKSVEVKEEIKEVANNTLTNLDKDVYKVKPLDVELDSVKKLEEVIDSTSTKEESVVETSGYAKEVIETPVVDKKPEPVVETPVTVKESVSNRTGKKLLKDDDIRYIRKNAKVSKKELAAKFNVSEDTIRRIIKGETYKDVK